MTIIMFAMIGAALNMGALYWASLGLYASMKITILLVKFISACNKTEEEV